MILLTTTSSLIQVVTAGTQVVKVHTDFADTAASQAVTPGRLNTSISTATTTTIVAAPASGFQRAVLGISITNTDTTNPAIITMQHTDGTTVVPLFTDTFPLLPGRTINYNDKLGWQTTPRW